MIRVEQVLTKKQRREFVNFPLQLYKHNKYYVPALYGDELKIFTSKNTYADVADSAFFLAYEGKKVVGRIQVIVQHQYNEIHREKCARFSRIHFINSQEVVNKLFEAAEKWAREQGMDTMRGPLNYSDLEREGLLVEGFDQPQTFEEEYNDEYYERLIKNCGYETEVEWVESQISAPKDPTIAPRMKKISDHVLKSNNLRFISTKCSKKKYIDRIEDSFFRVLDETYKDIYGVVPYTQRMKDNLISQFKLLINQKYVPCIEDANGQIVAVALVFPSISEAIRKSKGHLTPLGIARIFHAVRHPKIIDFALIGVMPEYQSKGVNACFLSKLIELLSEDGIQYGETNLNLTTNEAVQAQWKYFERNLNKRRRCYIKKI